MQRNIQEGLPIDTVNILNYWQKGVKQNSPLCISAMASIYYYGDISITADKEKAYDLLCLIPNDKLNAESNFLLGQMYELGDGPEQNFNTALSYYKKSAAQGNTNAMCKLGNFYEWGQGVAKMIRLHLSNTATLQMQVILGDNDALLFAIIQVQELSAI